MKRKVWVGAAAILAVGLAHDASAQGYFGPLLEHGSGWGDTGEVPLQATHMIHLPEGKILMFDRGVTVNQQVVTRLYSYNAWSGKFAQLSSPLTQNMFCAGHAHLPDGSVLIGGGGWESSAHDKVYLFNPSSMGWTAKQDMQEKRWYPTPGWPMVLSLRSTVR